VSTYDLVIRNGRTIDPANGLDATLDVAIAAGRIAAVAPSLDAGLARETWDAAGQIVTPGLVDLHTHVYEDVGAESVDADAIAWRTGVTTWVDAGTAGASTLAGLRRYLVPIRRSRIFAFVNISCIGLVGTSRELVDPSYADVERCVAAAADAPELAIGVKARIDMDTVGPNGLEPLRRAREAADELRLPLMVHIGHGPPAIDDVLALMGEGDILTHAFTGLSMSVLGADGEPRQSLLDARARGVLLDIGHGIGSFSFPVAERLLAAGILPDAISSDVSWKAQRGPLVDLPTCVSKFLALGLSLPEAIRMTTTAPAHAIRRPELGTLTVGAAADVAVFRLEQGSFTFYDSFFEQREGSVRLRNVLTLRDGVRMAPKLTTGPVLSDAWARADADVAERLRAAPELQAAAQPAGFGPPEPRR
jgi:dihydroorotase